MRIGIDFDNTLIDYDALFVDAAREKGWLPLDGVPSGGKNRVRQQLRGQEDGEGKWQRLQAEVYGPRIGEARLRAGADLFLAEARRRDCTLFIVSHKTRFATGDAARRCDLRQAAGAWMTSQGFFADPGFSLVPKNLHFAATRQEKVAKIKQLHCDCFIDDLPEVFNEPGFPPTTRKLLIDPWRESPACNDCRVFFTWTAIACELFDDP
ncbi:MAG: hypothetical protein HQM02_06165 [Magnetococcales bacterium]|nr:hypothetical protein [Magnetococcales bacterium]